MLSLLVLFAISSLGLGAEEIHIRPAYEVGDSFQLKIRMTREGARVDGGSTSFVEVETIEASEEGTLLLWKWGAAETDDPAMMQNPIMKAAVSAMEGLDYEIELSAAGEFVGLRNEQDVLDRLGEMATAVEGQIAAAIPEGPQRDQVIGALRQILSGPVLMQSATKQVELFFAMADVELGTDETVTFPYSQPAPSGVGEFSGEITISIAELDRENSIVHIDWLNNMDDEAVAVMMAPMLKALSTQIPEGETPQLTLTDRSRYEVDLTNGWARSVRHVRTIEGGPKKRIDTTIITIEPTGEE